jgi:hypothetical protein
MPLLVSGTNTVSPRLCCGGDGWPLGGTQTPTYGTSAQGPMGSAWAAAERTRAAVALAIAARAALTVHLGPDIVDTSAASVRRPCSTVDSSHRPKFSPSTFGRQAKQSSSAPARYAAAVATLWRYVKIQAAVFVCGIVGPIFLAIYFGTQPEPSMKWAYWAGLFITTADVLIALALTNASDPKKQPADTRLALAVAKRRRSSDSDQSSSSSTYDPFSSTAFSFSTDSGSSSTDYSSSDYSSSSDSGSSSSSSD